jgi:hypothetical protein
MKLFWRKISQICPENSRKFTDFGHIYVEIIESLSGKRFFEPVMKLLIKQRGERKTFLSIT